MDIWNLKAHIYSQRDSRLFSWILRAEKRNIGKWFAMIDGTSGPMLDIGSGTGQTLDIYPNSSDIICFDQSRTMLTKLQLSYATSAVQGDALFLPFHADSFPLISCIGVCEYLQDLTAFFRQVHQLLNKNGFLVTTSAPPNFWNGCRCILGNKLYLRHFNDVLETAEQAGMNLKGISRSMMQEQYVFQKE